MKIRGRFIAALVGAVVGFGALAYGQIGRPEITPATGACVDILRGAIDSTLRGDRANWGSNPIEALLHYQSAQARAMVYMACLRAVE